MRNLIALTWRELVGYFVSPMAYLVLTVLVGVAGFFFYITLDLQPVANLEGWLGLMYVITLFVAPVITMRLLSEEFGRGTIEMLMTTAVTETQVVVSKFLGAMLFFAFLMVPTAIFALIVALLGDPDPGPIVAGYAGLFLTASLLVAAGLFFSSLTRSQIVAAVLALVTFLVLYFVGFPARMMGGTAGAALEYIGLVRHMEAFLQGLVDLRDVAYFATGTVFFLFLSIKSLELRRC